MGFASCFLGVFLITNSVFSIGCRADVPQLTIDLIVDFEGWKAAPYNDPVGLCTVGYGHLIDYKRCQDTDLDKPYLPDISVSTGRDILGTDVEIAATAVNQLVTVSVTPEQISALSSFVLNIGTDRFQRSTLLKLLNSGQTNLAAREFSKWVLAKGVKLNGLVARRKCEAALFMGNIRIGDKFDRSNCGALGIAPNDSELIDIYIGEL